MNPHDPHLAWLIWSLLFLALWVIVYRLLRSPASKRKMLTVSLWTTLTGFTEPIFVPRYWNPPSLFDLAHRTGFDIESFIFAFAVGGLATAAYEWLLKRQPQHASLHAIERQSPRHRYHLVALLAMPLLFIALLLGTAWNPIYTAVTALVGGGLASWLCRPDLQRQMITGGLLFLGLYFLYFLTLTALWPGYVERVWNLAAISGVLIAGVPLEELLFAFSFGFMWSSVYEHVAWRH